MLRKILVVLGIGVYLSGCAIMPTPQNAKEYRAAVVKDAGSNTAAKSYTVKRPYHRVIKIVKKKIQECVDKKIINRTSCVSGAYGGQSCTTQKMTYNTTFKRGKKRSELHVQLDMTSSFHLGGKPPKDGMFIAVIDITKKGKRNTVIKEYAPNSRKYFRKVPKAVKHWVNRTNMGCPDLTGSIYL